MFVHQTLHHLPPPSSPHCIRHAAVIQFTSGVGAGYETFLGSIQGSSAARSRRHAVRRIRQ